ncbi:hypothetical protein LJB86_02320 [Deltaproteobacteria bacterium OttesenSCG-928-M10]|nr:hypothetical protein [Deltaproteobacteria bacterium OttesenSCG-928-M10]
MTHPVAYDIEEQLGRIADGLEALVRAMEPVDEVREIPAENETDQPPHLSLFFEKLPNWQYNCLRRKMIPTKTAAMLLGLSPAQLASLERKRHIEGKSGRYSLIQILEYMDGHHGYDDLIRRRKVYREEAGLDQDEFDASC